MVLDILDKHQGKDTDRRAAIARKQESKVGPGF